ncbi:MAG: XRE family transcriptional regulator [Planctomycetota bacterium]
MMSKVGAAVAAERSRQGLRVEDLGVDASVVQHLEAGMPDVTVAALETIARALQVDHVALRRGVIVARPRPSVFLRHSPLQDFHPDDATTLDLVLDHARSRNVLTSLLGDDVGLFPRSIVSTRTVAADKPLAPAFQGYHLARELRTQLGLATEPIVDVRELAEVTLGVAVLTRQLLTLGSSAMAVKAGEAAAIVLAPGATTSQARVWLAHEICHALFDADTGGTHVVVDFVTDKKTHQAEQRARAFAAEFLLPADGLRQIFGPPQSIQGTDAATKIVGKARDHFGATWQVTANQVCNQEFVDKSLREWLEQMPPTTPGSVWTATLPQVGGPSIRVSGLVRRAHEAGLITDSEARAVLGIDPLGMLPWDTR